MHGDFKVGAFRVEPRRNRIVHTNGEARRIKPRSMQVLLRLAESPGAVVAREAILDDVWERRAVGDEVLSVAIAELRKVLDDDPKEASHIQTFPGKGYSLIAPVEREHDAENAKRPRRALVLATIGIVVLAGAVAFIDLPTSPTTTRGPVPYQLTLNTPEDTPINLAPSRPFALSSDGSRLVYVSGALRGGSSLYLHDLTTSRTSRIEGTDDGFDPFFSPDGSWVGFITESSRRLFRVPVSGGSPIAVTKEAVSIGASWPTADTIVLFFNPAVNASDAGIVSVSIADGTRRVLTRRGESEIHRWPSLLPDKKTLLFTIHRRTPEGMDHFRLVVQRPGDGAPTLLVEDAAFGRYAASGHLLFHRGGRLFAAPFSLETLRLGADPEMVIDDVGRGSVGAAKFELSENGTLVYVRVSSGPGGEARWVGHDGVDETLIPVSLSVHTRLSPDEKELAVALGNEPSLVNLDSYHVERLTREAGPVIGLAWHPDGKRLSFGRVRRVFLLDTSTQAAPEVLLHEEGTYLIPASWSRSGEQLLYLRQQHEVQRFDVWLYSLADGTKEPIVATEFNELAAELSPDGEWVAYVSDESGEYEIYLKRLRGKARPVRISREGGSALLWSPEGDRIWYWSEQGMHEVRLEAETDSNLIVKDAKLLFHTDYPRFDSVWVRDFDYSAWRRQFLLLSPESGLEQSSVNVRVNWFTDLEHLQ
ncbi:MAG TPA: winged helix-turn-helix domain-containing protein, partial [Vicinamibacteria bacterium]|nr:winged helix-turn-helix domain-containing protein [Vicinamibacteria bacterium]